MKKVASLRYGVIFKKAFSQPAIFTAFAQDFLGITLNIDHVETEKSFDPIVGKVDSRFDLFAEDKENRIIVDIQHVRSTDHYDRFLHYHCVALLEQVANSKNYSPNLTVFTIVLLTSGDRHKVDMATIDFDPKDRNGKALGEISHKILYLCPKYVSKETPQPYRQWLEAIDDSLDEEVDESRYDNQMIHDVFSLIEKSAISPQELARMKEEYNQEEMKKARYLSGVEAGEAQTQLAIAEKMLKEGLAHTMIHKITGISLRSLKEMD
ncbi:MAG: PD-(D/E)XK nuclease family transposase [Cocleimonas sp.]|nr:PD-(D/E)XK nuclease family transposase [Cocleimonas sp.]